MYSEETKNELATWFNAMVHIHVMMIEMLTQDVMQLDQARGLANETPVIARDTIGEPWIMRDGLRRDMFGEMVAVWLEGLTKDIGALNKQTRLAVLDKNKTPERLHEDLKAARSRYEELRQALKNFITRQV